MGMLDIQTSPILNHTYNHKIHHANTHTSMHTTNTSEKYISSR